MRTIPVGIALLALVATPVSAQPRLTPIDHTSEEWRNGELVASDRSSAELPASFEVFISTVVAASPEVEPATNTASFSAFTNFLIEPGAGAAPGDCVSMRWEGESLASAFASGGAAAAAASGNGLSESDAGFGEVRGDAPFATASTEYGLRFSRNGSPVIELTPIEVSADGSGSDSGAGQFFAVVGDSVGASMSAAGASATGLGANSEFEITGRYYLYLDTCSILEAPTLSGSGRIALIGGLMLLGLGVLRWRT